MDRREFLAASAVGALALPHALRAAEGDSKTKTKSGRDDDPQLRVVLSEADASPLAKEARDHALRTRDLANDPLPQHIAQAEGRARVALPSEPIQLSLRLKVPGFGEVYCWADNDGKGYTKSGTINFVVDAAATRLRRVREAYELAKNESVKIDPQTEKHLKDAAQPVKDVRTAYTALAAGLHAGEQISLARARNRIARLAKPRHEFFFGTMVAGYDSLGPKFEAAVRDRFNFATTTWYAWKNEQPVDQRIDYARSDGSIQWCLDRHITPKGFGYCYMIRGATPEWIRTWPYEKILPEYVRVVEQTMKRYSGKLQYAEIINEAHDKANLWKLSQPQILEITRAVCHAAPARFTDGEAADQ